MTDPKKPKNNLTTKQSIDIEKQRAWLNNWNKKRVINGKNINNKTDIPFSDDIHIDDLNYGNKRSKTYGEFDSLNNRIVFDENYTDKPGIPTHELSHRFQKDLKNNNNSNYNNYIKSPIETMIGPSGHLLGPYTSDPEENHAEINRFRYNNGLKPDQVITPEDMKGYNREGYNLDHFDNDRLMNLLNTTADNSNLSNVNYAAYGGNINKQQNNNNIYNMSNKTPKYKKKISEEDLKKHLDERHKNVVEKDNIPTFKPEKKIEDHVIKKDSYTNVHLNKKGEVVTKDEQGIYRPIVRKQTTLSQGKKKSHEEYVKEQERTKEMQSNDLGLRAPLHYLANPDHMLGDFGNLAEFKPLKNFNNSDKDAQRYNFQALDPFKSKNERFKNNLNEGLNLVPSAAINLGLASMATKGTLSALKEAYNPIPLPFGASPKYNVEDQFKYIENQSDSVNLLESQKFLPNLNLKNTEIEFALGGNLKQQTNNNMLNEFNEGGTHEQNPLGGIPMGQGQNGQMNTVEEGETMKGDFIYSDRITLSPDVISQFNLPKSLAGKTAADASKIINKQFKDRSNKIDLSTKQNFLDKIGDAQEAIKAQEQAQLAQSMEVNSQEVPDMMEGQIPQGMEEFTQPQQQMFNGGELSQGLSMLGASGAMGQHTGINQAATALDLGNTAFGKTGIDTSGATDVDPGSVKPGMMGVTSALKGAQAGAMFGPIGTGVGAAIGLGAGLIGGFKAKKDALKAHQNFEIGQSNMKVSSFAKGGNMYRGGGQLDQFGNPIKPWQQPSSRMTDDPNFNGGFGFKNMTGAHYATELPLEQQVNVKYTPERGRFYKQSFNQMGRPQISNDLGYTSKLNYNDPDTVTLSPEQLQENSTYSNPENAPSRMFGPQSTGHYEGEMYDGSKLGKVASKVGKYAKDNYGNALRYAPVAMNAYQLHQLNKEGYDTVDPILNNTRYNPEYMDEKALTNQINAESNYANSALANSTNGSLGSLRNNILGSQLNKTKALSDAYSKVADANRGQNATAQQFNLGVDEANIARRVSAEDKTAMNKGAFKTERSKLLGQIGNDLGNIGKETVYKKLAGEAFGYSYDGKYLLKSDGTKVSEEELDSTIKTNLSSVGATEKDGKYFDTTGKEISKEEVLKMIGTQKTFNKNYQGKFSSMNTNFGNISLTNNKK